MTPPSAQSAAQGARTSTVFRTGARLGFAVDGLLHVLIGALAVSVAVGAGGESADQSGAMSQLASTPGGVVVLWVIVVGLLALAVWDVMNGALFPRGEERTAGKRLSAVGRAIAYLAIGVTAFTFARGSSTSSSQSSTSLSATLLSAPGGVILLIAIGLAVIGVGVFFVVKGARRTFTREIRVPAGSLGRATRTIGAIGYVAKGLVLTAVGVLFVVGAVTFDPDAATGLDGALKALAELPFGTVILIAVGIGLITYGVYSGLRARLAKL